MDIKPNRYTKGFSAIFLRRVAITNYNIDIKREGVSFKGGSLAFSLYNRIICSQQLITEIAKRRPAKTKISHSIYSIA